jgi:hypothetical protein
MPQGGWEIRSIRPGNNDITKAAGLNDAPVGVANEIDRIRERRAWRGDHDIATIRAGI